MAHHCHAGVAELADAPDLGSGGRPWGFKSLHPHHLFADVAQLVERRLAKAKVAGSRPVVRSIFIIEPYDTTCYAGGVC